MNEIFPVCDCVPEAFDMLDEVLAMFSNTSSTGDPYLDMAAFSLMTIKHGRPAVTLILSLLWRLGYVAHTGNLTSSSWLTEKGVALRDALEEDVTEADGS